MTVRVLVVTVVHHPQDARIRYRQIPAMLAAGFEVRFAAPFTGYGLPVPGPDPLLPGLTCADLPRAAGRHRSRALCGARRLLADASDTTDLVLVHDPELLAAVPVTGGPPVVWDVHEDTAGAVSIKPWLPRAARGPVAAAVVATERLAERRHHLVLAEYGYTGRFARPHPVVPNTTSVPPSVPTPGTDRVVHLGHLTAARGAPEVLLAARELRRRTDGAVAVHLIGPADAATTPAVLAAAAVGDVVWHGFVPNDTALQMLDGAMAGLQVLRDNPNYRVSIPTKTMEYLAHGVPAVTSSLPHVARLLADSGGGVTVPGGSPEYVGAAIATEVLALREDSVRRSRTGAAGHRWAREHLDWNVHSRAFTDVLARWATG